MGTHPIFESDFDCLTEFLRNSPNFRMARKSTSSGSGAKNRGAKHKNKKTKQRQTAPVRNNTSQLKVESGAHVNHSVNVGPGTTIDIERHNHKLRVDGGSYTAAENYSKRDNQNLRGRSNYDMSGAYGSNAQIDVSYTSANGCDS